MGAERSTGEFLGRVRHRAPHAPPLPCPSCGRSVPRSEITPCASCSKQICSQCGVVLSLHALHSAEDHLGLSHSFDEEVARTGVCSPDCAEGLLTVAVASRLLDDLRERLRKAGTSVDQSRGFYGPEFVLNLPGLPKELTGHIGQYCRTEGTRRVPIRYAVDALLQGTRGLQMGSDGTGKLYPDSTDPAQFVVLRGQPFFLEMLEKAISRGAGSYWDTTWADSVRGIANVLSVACRFEEAAKVFEIGGFFQEAGEIRARGSPVSQRDLSALLQQFRQSGLVSAYRCPSCGASIRVTKETSESKLQTCPYCGSAFRQDDLSDFFSAILGTPAPE